MKRIIISLFTILITYIGFSQEYEYVPFPDSGVIWSEVYQPPLDIYGNFPPPIYERFSLNGEDTILNEISYKKLYIFSDTVFSKSNATCIGGIREDENKKVFFKGDSVVHHLKPSYYHSLNPIEEAMKHELLLYDFSLAVGDTFKNGNLSLLEEYLIVSSIDTILIGGTNRKKYNFELIEGRSHWVHWIEGIGSVKGLLFTSGDMPTNGLNNDLICFKQNEEILYFNNYFTECFPVLSSIETKKNDYSDINVFPNPTKGSINFKFGKQEINLIQIIDCKGQICGVFDIQMQSDFLLSLEKYQPGIYFYIATEKQGIGHTGKFVVQ